MSDPISHQPGAAGRSLLARIFISADEPRLRAAWRLSLQVIILLVLSIAFGVLALFFGVDLLATQGRDFFVTSLFSALAMTISVYLARRLFDRRTFTSLGLRLDGVTLGDLGAGLLIAGLIFLLIYILEWAAGWLTFDSYAWEQVSWSVLLVEFGGAFALFVVAGWMEEIWDRGYLLQNLEQGLNTFWGVLLSSAVFAASHLANPNVSWVAVLGILVGGFFLAFAYLRTRSLWLPIGLHLGWNIFEGPVFGFPVSGMLQGPRLLRHTIHGPDLFTGGAFGPEAGLVLLPGLLFGACLVALYTRGRRA